MGWSRAGGDPPHPTRGGETEGKRRQTGQEPVFLPCDALPLPGERRMSLTGVNEEAGCSPTPPHTRSLAFCGGDADDSRTVRCSSVTGGAFCCEYV